MSGCFSWKMSAISLISSPSCGTRGKRMGAGTTKPTMVIYANCAGQLLAYQLRQLSVITDRFDVHWIRNFSSRAEGDEVFQPDILPRCEVFMEQVGNFR